jgi:hypothetical protein
MMIEKRVQLRLESQPAKKRLSYDKKTSCMMEYSETSSLLKSVAKIRLVKTGNPSVCV